MARSPISAEDLRSFEALLREQRAETDAALSSSDVSLDQVRSAKSDGTTDDEHDPDGTTLTAEWSRISGLHDELQAKAAAIDGALGRIASGGYGRCIRCGLPISRARLLARPATPYCIDCARALENHR